MHTLSLFLFLAIACTGTGTETDNTEGSACQTNANCGDGVTCVAYGSGAGTCLLECSAQADECGASAECAGIGAATIDVCQETQDLPTEQSPPTEEERPRIPCDTDDECGGGMVCATFDGFKDCTIECGNEEACTIEMGGLGVGVTIDLMTCAPDEGDTSRTVCLPDPACYLNMTSCIDMSGF